MVICKIAQYFPSAIAELRALSYARFCEFFLVEFRPFVAVDIQVFKLTFLVQRYGWQLHVYQFIIYAHNQGRRYWGWHPPPQSKWFRDAPAHNAYNCTRRSRLTYTERWRAIFKRNSSAPSLHLWKPVVRVNAWAGVLCDHNLTVQCRKKKISSGGQNVQSCFQAKTDTFQWDKTWVRP